MKAGKIFVVVLIVAVFAGGFYLGQSGSDAPVITQSRDGAGYSGGYDSGSESSAQDAQQAKDASQKTAGQTHVVEDGDSIMQAVKRAQPGDTIQVMPGTYYETVY
ncbi:MAG TPA: hypothetical protein VK972_08755, partial [Wenzhouxiangella sp.]|nr:hypothetical protein [Wenzhouxiangella sp.]